MEKLLELEQIELDETLIRPELTIASSDAVFFRGHCPMCAGDAPFHKETCPLHVEMCGRN